MISIEEVRRLARSKGAVILAHNYQRPEVQDAADYVGDSLGLSIRAMEAEAELIVFAGVDFMAEQAAILNPGKVVLHPDTQSRCPMAAMLTPEVVREYRERYPGAPFVAYVNTLAEVKALADYVVTSSSAVKLISQLDVDTVLFGPDKNLADYVAERTGKEVVPVPSYGHCPVHVVITPSCLERAREEHPRAKLLAHPECLREIRREADFVGSTSQMVRAAAEMGADEYIVATEVGLLHRIEKLGKRAYPASPYAVCVDMKRITLEKVARCLREGTGVVRVEPKVARKVREVLERSLEMIGVEVPWRRS